MDQSGHDGIKVDDADGFPRFAVKQNVVEFRIVVGDTFRDFAFGVEVEQKSAFLFAFKNEVHLFADIFQTSHLIFSDGFFKIFNAPRGVVEVGDRVIESAAGNIHKFALKTSESLRRKVCL